MVSALVGIGAGSGGLAVSIALRGIEHLAYGYSADTYLDGISQAPPWQRVAVLAIAGWLSDKAGVTSRERRILIACGAGAGLAAVYGVPLGGALFTVEILLAKISFATALPALATAAIATVVAQIVVPSTPLYTMPHLDLTPSLFVGATPAGPVLGFASIGFVRPVRFAATIRPQSWWILLVMPVAFATVGLIAIPFPEVLGNGRALGQAAFSGLVPVGVLGVLGVLRSSPRPRRSAAVLPVAR